MVDKLGRESLESAVKPQAGAWRSCFNAVAAACIAEAATLPIEVAKVKLQLQKASTTSAAPHVTGLISALRTIHKHETYVGLFKGLEAGMHKQFLYAGLRLGLYDHFASSESTSTPTKLGYAVVTTGVGIVVANPSDVVQVKYMAHNKRPAPRKPDCHPSPPTAAALARPRDARGFASLAHREPAAAPRNAAFASAAPPASSHSAARPTDAFTSSRKVSTHHRFLYHDHRRRLHGSGCGAAAAGAPPGASGAPHVGLSGPKTTTGVPLRSARLAYYVITKEEGIKGLYRGFSANFLCSSIQGATEVAAYDQTKSLLLRAGFEDAAPVHLLSGLTAGFTATVLSNPFDVVATRLMAGKLGSAGADTNFFSVVRKMWNHEGILGFYKGFGPNILRIGSFNVIMWYSYEQIRRLGM